MFRRLIWVIDEIPHRAALNMAIDEALLSGGGDCPLFRAYHWLESPVSIGYFSSWEQTSALYPDREIVRRWTGGGLVEHGADFTYSLLLPSDAGPPPNRELYREMHSAIVRTLAVTGRTGAVVAKGSEAPAGTDPVAACFAKSVKTMSKLMGLRSRARPSGAYAPASFFKGASSESRSSPDSQLNSRTGCRQP